MLSGLGDRDGLAGVGLDERMEVIFARPVAWRAGIWALATQP
jgi:hypothetical protein